MTGKANARMELVDTLYVEYLPIPATPTAAFTGCAEGASSARLKIPIHSHYDTGMC
jgi:hypothetical protein